MAIFSAYILNIIQKIKCKTFFVVEMPSYKLLCSKTLHSMLLKKQKHLFWCRKNNFSYINRAMVYGFYGPGEKFNNAETIQFSKRKMQEYHKRN
jgi:ferrous iron transport protein B